MVAQFVDVSTGLDSSGNIQHKGGSLDANWTVTGAVNPLNPPNAYVVAPGDADWNSQYFPWPRNGPYSSWIAANPFDATGNGNMTFTDTFDVATPSTAIIIGGAWTIDDYGTLSLNGHVLSTLPNGTPWDHLHAFSTTASDFVAGLNTLTMQGMNSNFVREGARLRGWLVGAGSDVSDHIATGATTNPSPTLSSLLPPETYTGDLAYHSDWVAQVPEASAPYVDLSTGLDSSGNIQHKGGSLDANWTVTGASNPLNPPDAYVVGPHDADQGFSGGWIRNGAYSSWIAANPFDANGNVGNMTFTRTFNVATPSTAIIIGGAWTSDNDGTLSLNGHLLSTLQGAGWDHLHAFSTTASDFVAGSNTLTMQIPGDGIDGGRLRGWLVGAGSDVSGPIFHSDI